MAFSLLIFMLYMKTRRNIYYSIAVFLILLNLIVDFVSLPEFFADIENNGFSIGYLIGAHFLMIIGFILLRMGYKLNKKIKFKEDFDINTSIENLGKL